ncbi:MAG: hypothetical protein HYV09_25390 [Deltaproteobacteria bacterium]|nr:hypothetical protein [Deltaproteobacteria bacterium]
MRARRGRPKKVGAGLPHVRRPAVDARRPHHVTVRMRRGVWNLRSQRCFRPVAEALRAVRGREGFRVVHFSVQGNHLHLVTEAESRRSMTLGMRALLIRIARQLNRVMQRRGPVLADRFHERILSTPTEVRNVVRYVIGNHASHLARLGKVGIAHDPFSSAVVADVVSAASSWLLTRGWLRAREGPHVPPPSVRG